MAPQVIQADDENQFLGKIKETGKPVVVVDFFAEWCGPCKMIAPKLKELEELEPAGTVAVLKLDVDESSDVAMALGIQAMPTFYVYKNGTKVGELTGANFEKLKALVQQHVGEQQ